MAIHDKETLPINKVKIKWIKSYPESINIVAYEDIEDMNEKSVLENHDMHWLVYNSIVNIVYSHLHKYQFMMLKWCAKIWSLYFSPLKYSMYNVMAYLPTYLLVMHT